MISERYSVLKTLREVVFNKAFGANERSLAKNYFCQLLDFWRRI